MISRLLLALALFWGFSACHADGRTLPCAYRFDATAYTGEGSKTTQDTQRVLSQPQWQYRAPWFARRMDADHLVTNGATAEVTEHEIAYARQAGLACWVFFLAGDNSMLNTALELYQQSPHKEDMPWAMGLQPTNYSPQTWDAHLAQWVGQMQQANYFKVLDGRPLVVFLGGHYERNYGGQPGWAAAVQRLREAAKAAGLKNPYVVALGGSARNADDYARAAGADAISSYNPIIVPGVGAAYETEDKAVRQFWQSMSDNPSHLQAIPTALTGWDGRALKHDTPDFYKSANSAAARPDYVTSPTPAQLTAHLQAAADYARAHRDNDPAGLVFIYAWNEYAEAGSVLSPSYDPAAPSKPDARYIGAAAQVRW